MCQTFAMRHAIITIATSLLVLGTLAALAHGVLEFQVFGA
jgi:hypothetical protein